MSDFYVQSLSGAAPGKIIDKRGHFLIARDKNEFNRIALPVVVQCTYPAMLQARCTLFDLIDFSDLNHKL